MLELVTRGIAIAAIAATSLAAQESRSPHPLRVAFVGSVDDARTEVFREFLGERFAAVEVVERKSCDPRALAAFDVVLLDWSQQDGVIAWMDDDERKDRPCPLGERAAWDTPTVLLGSAGLNVACAWNVRGGSG